MNLRRQLARSIVAPVLATVVVVVIQNGGHRPLNRQS